MKLQPSIKHLLSFSLWLALLICCGIFILVGVRLLETLFGHPAPTSSIATQTATKSWLHYPVDSTNYWTGYYQIWHCDDGRFEVRSDVNQIGYAGSLEEAREIRYQRALKMADFCKLDALEERQRLPDCGKRVE